MKKKYLFISSISLLLIVSCSSRKLAEHAYDDEYYGSDYQQGSQSLDYDDFESYTPSASQTKKTTSADYSEEMSTQQKMEILLDDSYRDYLDENNAKEAMNGNETEEDRVVRRVTNRAVDYGEYSKKLKTEKHSDYMRKKRNKQSVTARKSKAVVDKLSGDKSTSNIKNKKTGSYKNSSYK